MQTNELILIVINRYQIYVSIVESWRFYDVTNSTRKERVLILKSLFLALLHLFLLFCLLFLLLEIVLSANLSQCYTQLSVSLRLIHWMWFSYFLLADLTLSKNIHQRLLKKPFRPSHCSEQTLIWKIVIILLEFMKNEFDLIHSSISVRMNQDWNFSLCYVKGKSTKPMRSHFLQISNLNSPFILTEIGSLIRL